MKQLLTLLISCFSTLLVAQTAEWTSFSPPPNARCMAAKGNTILIGTLGAGIVQMDTNFNRTLLQVANSGIPSDTVLQLAVSTDDDWWMYHTNGISRFQGSVWQTWLPTETGLPANSTVRAFKSGPDNSLYIPTNNGVAIFKNNTWTVLNTSNSGLLSNDIWDVAFGADGKVYYASVGSGVIIQDGTTWTFYDSNNTGITNMNNVYSVAITSGGTLWLTGGTTQLAAIRLAKFEGGVWTGYTSQTIGISTAVPFYKLSADNNNRLMLTNLRAVSLLSDETWEHFYNVDIGCGVSSMNSSAPAFTAAQQILVQNSCQFMVFNGESWKKPGTNLPGPAGGVLYNGIAEDTEGRIWIGTELGRFITRYDGNAWNHFYPTDLGATNNDVFSIQGNAAGEVWFGLGKAEILKWENDTWTYFDTCKAVFTNHITLASATAPNGDQWFSFRSLDFPSSSLARYSNSGEWQFFTADDSPDLNFAYVRKIAFDNTGKVWFATSGTGIITYNGTNWSTYYVDNSDLPDNNVYDLTFAPDGLLWACTPVGLVTFDGQNWTNITSTNSTLPSNQTRRLAFDKAGGMYLAYWQETSGAEGPTIAVFRNGFWTNLVPPGWENRVNESPDAFITDSKNRLWFAEFTRPGVYRYDPMLVNTAEPSAEIPAIAVSPNPCGDMCLITFENTIPGTAQLRLCNSVGQTVLEQRISQGQEKTMQLNVAALPSGIYSLDVRENGRLIGKAKMVKQ
ncbi:MAG: T9SS type A sorting domain-containing protein [Saprospiraceae bacterium]|nr:T9SS type A sorting domain-containing protein [Saprospiraceae bacterium]